MSPFPSIMRRFSRSSSLRKGQQQAHQSPTSYPGDQAISTESGGIGATSSLQATAAGIGGSAPTSYRDQTLGGGYVVFPDGTVANEGRPISSATDQSFDFANRPVTSKAARAIAAAAAAGGSGGGVAAMNAQMSQPHTTSGNLSRTDHIVLKHFWDTKYQENGKRDLHYLKFPFFPSHPSHKDLLPYCEIYHLVKTSPGATIVSLGSANGVYIGFELQTGSQLHIDLDDDWFVGSSATSITHHRIFFRSYNSFIGSPDAMAMSRTWPKPLTIEFLEEQYQAWCRDLMSVCWEAREVRELGTPSLVDLGVTGGGDGVVGTSLGGNTRVATGSGGSVGSVPGRGGGGGVGGGAGARPASIGDDGYISERSTGHGI